MISSPLRTINRHEVLKTGPLKVPVKLKLFVYLKMIKNEFKILFKITFCYYVYCNSTYLL